MALALGLALPALLAAPVLLAPSDAAARPSVRWRARTLLRQLRSRGTKPGEMHLALAALYARAGHYQPTIRHLKLATRYAISKTRVDLVLALIYRKKARYDAALSTLVRVLVRAPRQPHALVALWKTLYECKLQGAPVKTDLDTIRSLLVRRGLHFPRVFKLASDATARSKKIAAAGYNALLGQRNRFAAQLFRAAIDALPSNARAHRGLGIALARQHAYARAAGAYLLYLEMNPDAADADEVDRVLMRYWKGLRKR